MATTPSPRGRVHTPPPPLHGPRYDNYEPYSPRRSMRVAAQRSTDHSFSSSRPARASTPVNNQSPTFDRKRPSPFPASDSDTDILPTLPDRLTSSAASFGMFHTPAKTPRKRSVPQGAMNGTARSLFPGRPATVEEAMPTPKKARKKAFNPFAIAEDGQEASSSSKIDIYTDSKDRVPTLDEDEANPFLSRNAAKQSKRRRNKVTTEEEMEEAVRNEEGLVYVFRGKKVLRRFDTAADSNEDDDDNLSDLEVRRKAGASANKRFTRSSIKPRLLFPSEEQKRAREAAEEADEEAVTDIEVPQPKAAVTPVKQQFHPNTPPSTNRSKRSNAEHEEVDTVAPIKLTRKVSAFGGWARRKAPPAAAPPSRKREGESLEGETAKRTRSGAS
ncbi:hypothetical protein FKW77_005356 [Venturia effusa]|uniref:Uncharacterized protein n=1 Tax=Venturia effusa TaxID=50376 RepID=A0A517LIR5_9PEZI|nr:hypothetical protein FKW77_005356 [Venturia effusa]